MTLDELIRQLKNVGYNFNVETNPVGPDSEWTTEEQEADCCEPVPDHDPCVEEGKIEPFDRMTDELAEEIGYVPEGNGVTVAELFANAEQRYGKGNVYLKEHLVGPVPCGEKHTRWVDTLGCCTDPDELIKTSGATTASPDDTLTYTVGSTSGEFPVTWHSIGTGVSVAKTDSNSARANFDECFCTPVVVYAQDTCESVAPWIVGRSGGTWTTIADESLSSPFGWFQDGVLGYFFVIGLNSDNTKVSTQSYWQAPTAYEGTKEAVCAGSYPGVNTSPIVTPQDSQGYEKCDGSNIWVQEVEGWENLYNVRYAIDGQGTTEFEHECMDSLDMEYDEDNSVEVLADYSMGRVYWENGQAPFTVRTSGVEFYLDTERTKTELQVYGQNVKVYTGDSCGTLHVSIEDACGQSVNGSPRATDGQWYLDYTNSYSINGRADISSPGREGGCPQTFIEPDGRCGFGDSANYSKSIIAGGWKLGYTMQHSSSATCHSGTFGCYSGAGCGSQLTIAEAFSLAQSDCAGRMAAANADDYCSRSPEQYANGCNCVDANYHIARDTCDFNLIFYPYSTPTNSHECFSTGVHGIYLSASPGFHWMAATEDQPCAGTCGLATNWQASFCAGVSLYEWRC